MPVNKVILLGNLGADPEVRQLPNSDTKVVSLRIATSERWKDKNSGETKDRTEWHRVEFFGAQADVIAKYFRKGSQIYIEGGLRTDKWQDKDGNDRYTTKIRGTTFSFVDRKGGDGENTGRKTDSAGSGADGGLGGGANRDIEEDIPF